MAGRQRKNDGLYEIRRSDIQGRGVFAKRRIRAGQKIIEYAGERISNAESDRRYDDESMRRHHTFLFTLDKKTVVDGNSQGNDSRYINHSCDPNCEAVIEKGKIWIYAKRNIQPGVELAYDYQYERTGSADDEKFYECRCGSPKCRGTIMKARRRRRKHTPRRSRA
jgi:SET domain-containing protein